jgi:DNA-binding transcriptional MerR regulator
MKYLTTLEVAHELSVSKQTLLNWLYAGKLPEPPRNKKGYRLWSPSRVSQAKRLIGDGRLHRRTVLHREGPDEIEEFARDVAQSLRDAQIELRSFVRALTRVHGGGRPRVAPGPPKSRRSKKA